MYYSAYQASGNWTDAEDAVHDAMIKLIELLDRLDFDNRPKLKAFCCIIARNKAIDKAWREKAITSSELREEIASDDPSYSPEQTAIKRETYEKLIKAIASLGETYRDACALRFVYGMKEREIASLLDIPEKTAQARIRRGKELLKQMIGEV